MKKVVWFFTLAFVAQFAFTQNTEVGKASYYSHSLSGKRTSSGEPYKADEFMCAHRTHPFGTLLLITRADKQKAVVVRVTDRGPFVANRIVDLSYAAAKELGLDRAGVAGVEMQVYEPGKPLPENLNWISVNPSRYGLQLTSSTNIEQIYKTSALLQDKGYNSAYIEANDVGGVTYYSLIVSTVGTHAEAELMRNRLKKTGFDCVIIDFETRELGK